VGHGTDPAGGEDAPLVRIPKRIITLVLILSVAAGGALLLLGLDALAKGFILGSLFSALNFFLMAVFLPMQFGRSRSKSMARSLASLCVRLALLAIPLVVAARHAEYAIASTVVGLFAVQIAIMVDYLWLQPRQSSGV
jgi:hypothetical protein